MFDPFAGSGSCGVACRERGYSYIGCEKSPVFYEAAARRLGISVTEHPKLEESEVKEKQ